MSFTFLHVADIHLDSPLHGLQKYEGAPVDAIRQATREALRKMVDLALERRVAFVVVAGDLYDGDWKDYNTGLFFITQMQRLREAGIPLFLIAGNHDAQNSMTRSLKLPDNTRMLSADAPETVLLEEIGVAIHGQSFANRAVLEDLSLAYPQAAKGFFNLGVLHTSLDGREGHDPYAPCTIAGLQTRQYQYWALGHVHQQEVLCRDPVITFAGNLQGRHIRETGAKGCWLVSVDDALVPTLEFQPLDVFRWELATIETSALAAEDDLWPAVRAVLQQIDDATAGLPHAVRIVLTGQTRLHDRLVSHKTRVTNQLRSLGIEVAPERQWIEKVSLAIRPQRLSKDAGAAEHPREELLAYIEELRAQPDELQRLGSDILDMLQKLPADLDLTTEGLNFADHPENWQHLLTEAEAVLADRLSGSGEEAAE